MKLWMVLVLISWWRAFTPFLYRDAQEARRGLDQYRGRDFPAAGQHFEEARREEPDPRLDFDLGAARYEEGKLKEAVQAFQAAGRGKDLPPGAAAYNLGKALQKGGQVDGALAAYRAALRENPADDEARLSYEWLLAHRQEEQQKSQDKQQDKKDKQDKQDKNQGQGEKGQGQDSKSSPSGGDEQKGDQKGDQKNPADQTAGQKNGEPQPSPAAGDTLRGGGQPGQLMSREEAARLLNAVTSEEREILAARLKTARRRKAEKDW